MATITKDGYKYDTIAKTRTSPTGKVVSVENMDAITPNLKADTPISLGSLNQTKQLTLPEQTPEITPEISLTPLQEYEQSIQDMATKSEENFLANQKAIGDVEAKERTFQEELGASENKKAYKEYEKQLEAEKTSLRRYKEDIAEQTTGNKAMTNELIRQEEAKSLRKQADIAILGNIALGKYNEALDTAKSKVEAELKPLMRQMDYYKSVMEKNQDLLTKSQTTKLQSLYSDVERQKNKEEERLTKGNEMIINALSFQAPSNIVNNAKSILEKGGTISDVASALGKYSGDFYKTELLRQQIETEKAQRNKIISETGKTKETPATQAQYTASGFANRVVQSKDIIDANQNSLSSLGVGQYLTLRNLPNALQTPLIQKQLQAERNFVNAVLRRESGAAISPEEFKSAEKQYFPMPGDSEEVLAQKKANRDLTAQNIINESGSAYVAPQPVNKFSMSLNKGGQSIPGSSIVQSVLPNGQVNFIIPNKSTK